MGETSRIDGATRATPSRPTGGVSNSALEARSATTTGDVSAFMAGMRLVSADDREMLKLNDQAFMIASVPNSRFGQGALALPGQTRLEISAIPFNDTKRRPVTHAMSRGAFRVMDFSMRVSTSGHDVGGNQVIRRLTIVLEPAGMIDGSPELLFVTACPISLKLHQKFSTMPGFSFSGQFFRWNSPDRNDGNATLTRV